MAEFYPDDISYYNHTYSELLFFKELKKQLANDDNFTIFYSVPWIEKSNSSDKLIRSECDFLICHKKYGFLCLELKGGEGIEIKDRTWILHLTNGEKRILNKSPFLQSSLSSFYFKDLFKKEAKKDFNGIYGSACVFPLFNLAWKKKLLSSKDNSLSHAILLKRNNNQG